MYCTLILGFAIAANIVDARKETSAAIVEDVERCCNEEFVTVDLTSGEVQGNLEEFGASIHSRFTAGRECDSRGVFKVAFDRGCRASCRPSSACGRCMLRVDMLMHDTIRTNWYFNIGDSQSNNGYGGDSSHQYYDAEVEGRGLNVVVQSNDNPSCAKPYQTFYGAVNLGVKRVSVLAADQFVRVQNNWGLDGRICYDQCLFGLNGQYDSQQGGTNNYDIYVAFNRVISGTSSRNGAGTCYAQLSWECCS